jgi:leucyl aminopeptidase
MAPTLSISFSLSAPKGKADTAIAFAASGNKLTASAEKLDKESGGLISTYLKRQKAFTAKKGQTLTIPATAKQGLTRIILCGLEKIDNLTPQDIESVGKKLYAALQVAEAKTITVYIDNAGLAADMAYGLMLASYSFEKYRSKKTENLPAKIAFVCKDADKALKLFKTYEAARTGVFLAKDLANLPPNDLYPESYAKIIQKELSSLGVKVTVLDEKQMKAKGFGAHLAVGQGSARPPRVVIMEWKGLGQKKQKGGPVAFVGKGITFDTGGISIKPASGMDEMKMDMGGSAAVVGAMKSLALRKAKSHVVGIVAIAENMPSDRAYRPGDIVTSLSGKTIEVLNTDAEGRLVLCDSLTYVQKNYKPQIIIDLATLTGAIVVALGAEYCGSFVNDDDLWSKIEQAGKDTGEKFWRMPLDEAYRKDMESKIADLRNIGTPGKAGSCTAAGFLEQFIENKTPWAHLDIAGTGMSSKGGTGFGVRTLDRLIADHYEA